MRTAFEIPTFVGSLSVVWDDDAIGTDAEGRVIRGAVVRSAFVKLAELPAEGARRVRPGDLAGDTAAVAAAIRRWSDGDGDALDPVAVLQPGGEFRQRVWQALRSVKAGTVIPYADLAALAGNPRAMRAAGTAMAINAVAPFVPCHRVVRTDRSIGNYAYGAAMKAAILEREGVPFD